MKKIISWLLAIGFLGSTLAATTGTLVLTGTVPQVLSITVTPLGIASILDLTTTQTDLTVGNIQEDSNSNTGYKISASSANNMKLIRSGGTEFIAYTFKYGATAYVLTPSDQVVKTVGTAGVYSNTTAAKISYTGVASASMVQGSYTDTITLTIQAN